MPSLYLLSLASQHNRWLSTRQSLIAGNIANANTPGYKVLDLEPFEAVMDATRLQLASTQPGHMAPDANSVSGATVADKGASWDVYHSGNNVSLEQELIKSGDVNRAYALNAGVLKSFHRMLMASAKGG